MVDRVRDDEPLRQPHRDALGRRRRVAGRRRRPGRRPHRGRDLPLPPRSRERHRDDGGRRRQLPHGQRSHRLDRRGGLHHADVGARQRPRRPAGPRHGRVVRVRHDDAARQPNGRHQRRLRARRLDPAVDDRRPPAGNGLPLPHRRAKRRRHDVRADPELPDERRAARDDRRRDALRALRHPHGNRRPGRSRDDGLVRARADDRVRHANGREAGGLGPRRCRRLRDGGRPDTGHRVPRAPRRPELGRDDARRRRRLPDGGPPDRRACERLRDLSRAGADPRGRRLRRARDPGLGRVRPRRRADGAHGRRPASRLELDDVRLVPAHGARARPPLRLPRRRGERSRHGDRGDGDVRHRGPSARRPWTAPPVHDRRDERAGPARRDRAARRDLRARRRRHADRPRPGRHPRRRPRQRLPPARRAAATACSAAPATTTSRLATAPRTSSSAAPGETAGGSTDGATSACRSRKSEAAMPGRPAR